MRECGLYLPGTREREVLQRPLRGHREPKRDQLPLRPPRLWRQAQLGSAREAAPNGFQSTCSGPGLSCPVLEPELVDPAAKYCVGAHLFPRFLREWMGKNITLFLPDQSVKNSRIRGATISGASRIPLCPRPGSHSTRTRGRTAASARAASCIGCSALRVPTSNSVGDEIAL